MRRVSFLAVAVLACGCTTEHAAPLQPPPRIVGWHHLASWSGHGSLQTETFTSDNGSFRIHWEAKNEKAPGKGSLKVQFRSGDSGRVIIEAVDHTGVGEDTAIVGDQVRWYYLTIEAANIEWLVEVDEPIMGKTAVKTDP